MGKYIDADKLIAEIERLQKRAEHYEEISLTDGEKSYWSGENGVLELLVAFIASLQQEQQEQDITGFEKALDNFGEAYATLVDRDNNPNLGIRVNAYHELVQERINEILSLAKEYVKQEQPVVDLDKEITPSLVENMLCEFGVQSIDDMDSENLAEFARHFYELGLKARKEE